MKNKLHVLSSLTIFVSAFLFSGCKREDTTPPRLTMLGDNPMTIYLNAPFVDPGVTVQDNEDGNYPVSSDATTLNPNVNLTGNYYINYSAEDNAGNRSFLRRTVIVKNSAQSFSHGYYVTGSCANGWYDQIFSSPTENNRIIFSQFGRYANANAKLSADVDNTQTVNIVQATIFCGTVPVNRTFSGGGAFNSNGDTLILNVTEITPTDTTNCIYVYAKL